MKVSATILSSALLLICMNLSGQKEGLDIIKQSDLKAAMTFLASDQMRGRETGSPENDLAALYIRSSLIQMGLKPLAQTGDYLQSIPLMTSEIMKGETFLKGTDQNGTDTFRTDSVIFLMAPMQTNELKSRLVFAGYGFRDTASGYDDFKNIDVKDKIIMIMTGSPVETAHDKNAMLRFEEEGLKIRYAYMHGAKGVICVYEPGNKFRDAYASGLAEMGASGPGTKIVKLKETREVPALQIVFITQYAADQLLKTDGFSLQSLQNKILSEKKPVSYESDKINLTLTTTIKGTDLKANNVIGIIEGTDPSLKNECIIYTAHFDHIGVDRKGEVFNGADDNASGSVSLLEVAKAFMNLHKKPARSIVFAWVNGEEKGLLGSEYYSENPVIGMNNTLLDINLDMVGRSRMPSDTGKFMGIDPTVSKQGEIQMYTDQKGSDFLGLIGKRSADAGIRSLNMGKDPVLGSSDHASFMSKGVPFIFFNSGFYPDLHSTGDDVEKIDFDKMERVTRLVFLLGYDIANQRKRFVPDTITE